MGRPGIVEGVENEAPPPQTAIAEKPILPIRMQQEEADTRPNNSGREVQRTSAAPSRTQFLVTRSTSPIDTRIVERLIGPSSQPSVLRRPTIYPTRDVRSLSSLSHTVLIPSCRLHLLAPTGQHKAMSSWCQVWALCCKPSGAWSRICGTYSTLRVNPGRKLLGHPQVGTLSDCASTD